MQLRRYQILLVAGVSCLITTEGRPATIIWGTHEGAGARDFCCWPLAGDRVPGGTVNLANGALIQLIKSVGAVDNPYAGGPPDFNYWIVGPEYTVDDIILDEVHVGYGLGPPGAPALGEWSRTVDVQIEVGDVLYARALNVPKADADGTHEITIGKWLGDVVSNNVTQVANPETYYFDNLSMVWPEPSPLTFVVPGLALWSLRKVKRKNRRDAHKS